MNNKNKQEPISIEDAKKLFFDFGHDPSIASVHTSVWKSHWANAQGATSKQQLINMLNNHKRLFDGKPSASGFVSEPDHSEERVRIIKFLKNRLKNEFGIVPEGNNHKSHFTDQKIIDYLDQFCVKTGDVEVKAIDIHNGTCTIVVPVFNGENEFSPYQIATLDFEFDFDGEDVTIYKFPKNLLSDEDRIFVESEIADEISRNADKIVLRFGNIVSELEEKNLKLLKVKGNNNLFVVDREGNLYGIEPYYAGGYLDRFIGEKFVISFERMEQPIRDFEDWRKEFLDAAWVKNFIERVVKKEYPGFKTSSLDDRIQSASARAAVTQPTYESPAKESITER